MLAVNLIGYSPTAKTSSIVLLPLPSLTVMLYSLPFTVIVYTPSALDVKATRTGAL